MPNYIYKARSADGKVKTGKIESANRQEAAQQLREMGYTPTQLAEAASGGSSFDLGKYLKAMKKVKSEKMVMFYVQFSNLINSGIPVLEALETFGKQDEDLMIKEVANDILKLVEEGQPLSEAFSQHPKFFPPLFVNMVKAGESSGKLDKVLIRYAHYYEQQVELEQKVKGATFYPMMLLSAGVIVVLFIVTSILPKFVDIFIKAEIEMPAITQVIYDFGQSIVKYWYLYGGVIAAIWWSVKWYVNTPKGRYQFHKKILNVPGVGNLARFTAISRFTRTMGTLVGSGVPLLECFDIGQAVVGNDYLAEVIGKVRDNVEVGGKISESLKDSGEFPADAVQMIAIGEQAGSLDNMMEKIAAVYDQSVSYAVKKVTTMIEPIFLAVLGVLIGGILASVLLPMFNMMNILGN